MKIPKSSHCVLPHDVTFRKESIPKAFGGARKSIRLVCDVTVLTLNYLTFRNLGPKAFDKEIKDLKMVFTPELDLSVTSLS